MCRFCDFLQGRVCAVALQFPGGAAGCKSGRTIWPWYAILSSSIVSVFAKHVIYQPYAADVERALFILKISEERKAAK